VHYENDERVLISTHTFIYVNMSVYVCAIPEGRSAVALNQQPLELVASLSPIKLMWGTVGKNCE
jgi:hypothetical protein